MQRKEKKILELLLGTVAAVILASIVVIAVSPERKLSATKNSERVSHINMLASAIESYAAYNNGALPVTVPSEPTEICQSAAADCEGYVDLSMLTDYGTYLTMLPNDPATISDKGTGYQIARDTDGHVVITAPLAENGEMIIAKK